MSTLQQQQKAIKSLSFLNLSFAGLSGMAAVSVQTVFLTWISKMMTIQSRTGHTFLQMFNKIISKRAMFQLYKGEFSNFRYSATARFGDLVSNCAVISFFKNHAQKDVRQTPIFFQTMLSWVLASAWRFTIIPLDFLNRHSLSKGLSTNRLLLKLIYRKQKRVKLDIVPLYSWLLVQNYLMAYTNPLTYEKNCGEALLKHSAIGFASMSAYQIYKTIKSFATKKEGARLRSHLPQITLKGIYGVVFCNVTQLFMEYFDIKEF